MPEINCGGNGISAWKYQLVDQSRWRLSRYQRKPLSSLKFSFMGMETIFDRNLLGTILRFLQCMFNSVSSNPREVRISFKNITEKRLNISFVSVSTPPCGDFCDQSYKQLWRKALNGKCVPLKKECNFLSYFSFNEPTVFVSNSSHIFCPCFTGAVLNSRLHSHCGITYQILNSSLWS